jgi:hypothetical protein
VLWNWDVAGRAVKSRQVDREGLMLAGDLLVT